MTTELCEVRIFGDEKMSRSDMVHYISEITQTEICKDNAYCELLIKIWLKK